MEELSTLPICQLEKRIHMVNGCSKNIDFLPDELLQTIFSFIPTASLVVATGVCKMWHRVIYSGLRLHTNIVPQKHWYFIMCAWPNAHEGHVFDSSLDKWYHFTLPSFLEQGSFLASSCGLLCFLHNDEREKIYLLNPITSDWILLPEAPFMFLSYCEFALSVNLHSRDYMLSVIQFQYKPMPGYAFRDLEISIHLFESVTQSWSTLHSELIRHVKLVSNSVVCNRILYCFIQFVEAGEDEDRLIMYDLSDKSSQRSPISTIRTPLSIIDGHGNLMSHCGRLFLAGIVVTESNEVEMLQEIEGLPIWELENGSWHEVSRMPSEFIQWNDATDLDLITICSANGIFFVQYFQTSALYMFDVFEQQWRSFDDYPVSPGVPENLSDRDAIFQSFCFEPRLDMRP